jgi:hypothetical protein
MARKATLEEMATVCQDIADHEQCLLDHHYREYPHNPPWADRERRILVLTSAAHLFRVLATFEDRARAFVSGLIEEHRR